jgi:hypothetical protein
MSTYITMGLCSLPACPGSYTRKVGSPATLCGRKASLTAKRKPYVFSAPASLLAGEEASGMAGESLFTRRMNRPLFPSSPRSGERGKREGVGVASLAVKLIHPRASSWGSLLTENSD